MNTRQVGKPQKIHKMHDQRKTRNTSDDWRKQLYFNQKKLQKQDSNDSVYFLQDSLTTSRYERRNNFRHSHLQLPEESHQEYATSISLAAIMAPALILINHGVPASLALLILSSLVLANATKSNDSSYTPEYSQNFTEGVLSSPLKQKLEATTSLKEMLDKKFVIDNSVNQKSKKKLQVGCPKVREMIIQTGDKFPVAGAAIKRVMNDEQAKVICTTPNQIKEFISKAIPQETAIPPGAIFNHDTKAIHISVDNIDYGLIHHEFLHADIYFRHSKGICLERDSAKVRLPFFPASLKNIEKYEMALDEGDKRVREFKKLWMKEFNKKKLTKEETYKLKQYKNASKGCIPYPVQDIDVNITFLESLGWYPNNKDFTILTVEGIKLKILDVKKEGSTFIAYMESVTPAFSVFRILDDIEEQIIRGIYRHLPKSSKLAERHAYTFQNLSAKAAEVFYPEVTEIVADDQRKCGSAEKAVDFESEL